MELTLLLAKVFGIYLIVGGAAYTTRQRYFMSVVHHFVEERMLRMVVAVAEFIGGLFLIMSHNEWDTMAEGIISLIGWILAVEGALYLLLPDNVVRKIVKMFNTQAWYVVGGIVSIVAGVYLAGIGFGLL
jgi:uncharacterized membrane protein HdeD (DUF308 family)